MGIEPRPWVGEEGWKEGEEVGRTRTRLSVPFAFCMYFLCLLLCLYLFRWSGEKEKGKPHFDGWILRLRGWMLDGLGNG